MKGNNHEALLSRGIERRRQDEQTMTRHIWHSRILILNHDKTEQLKITNVSTVCLDPRYHISETSQYNVKYKWSQNCNEIK